MLKNLLKTWSILAQDEILLEEGGRYTLLKTKDWENYYDIESIYIELEEESSFQDTLQGYIQRCIDARKEWDFMIASNGVLKEYKVYDAVVWVNSDKVLKTSYATAHEALLTAYLTALSAQRTIVPRRWQHFKGGEIEVIGVGSWLDDCVAPFYNFALEEDPLIEVAFAYDGYYASEDYGDLVFYSHDGKNWARRVDSFLGLVGPEHPGSEGLLSFVEVGN